MTQYYDIHVNYGGGEGFSIPFETDSEKVANDEDVVRLAVETLKLDGDDRKYVDEVREIELDEYNQMKNI